ncbi:peptide MFS transporter [Dysgonomonas sp. ZJ709]|uniref:peptide MFS transporter n=1 Tax=Dysgonomonas sp. ZJ709 TaxID=2709797 RepID=UPI0013EC72F6|nr:peptide MFS transporter [Dysgonomonas sp. ZJ709]
MLTEVSSYKEPSSKKLFGHPIGLYLLFFTELWERFSYYGMRAILILYLTKSMIEGGIGFDESSAGLIYGCFTGLVYFTPLIGGWLADTYLGQRKSIAIGGATMMIGQLTLFLFHSQFGLFLGLFLLIIGNGFFKPNIATLLGGLYKTGDAKRDSAFSIFYMGVNIGAFFAPLLIGFLADDVYAIKNTAGEIISHGYRYGFLAASIGMFFGQILYLSLSKRFLGDLGVKPAGGKIKASENDGVEKINAPLTPDEKQRIIAIFVYFFFAIFFFAGFEQAGSSISLYTEKFIDRSIGTFNISTTWFQSVNPLFIVLLTPLFAMLWPSKLGQKITTPVKMGSGLVFLGIGFFFMLGAVAQRGGDIADTTVKASMWWVVFTYLLHTIGELCLSPVGMSTVTKLSPPKLASLLMGVWLLSSCFANFLGGWIASVTGSFGAGSVYMILCIGAIVCGLTLICLNKKLLKMMHGVR